MWLKLSTYRKVGVVYTWYIIIRQQARTESGDDHPVITRHCSTPPLVLAGRSLINYCTAHREDGTVHLIYLNFYFAPGGLQVCGFDCTCCAVGDHPYDLEAVIVELGQTGVRFWSYFCVFLFVCFDRGFLKASFQTRARVVTSALIALHYSEFT